MQGNLLGNKEDKDNFSVYLIIFVIIFLLFSLFNNFYMIVKVDGDSMNYTLSDDDVLLVDISSDINRGDVVVFDMPYAKLIKRVIAIEGDELYSQNGKVYLKKAGEDDFVLLIEDYAKGDTTNLARTVVESGKVFVLGDNRVNSQDSRFFGCISLSSVNGVVNNNAIKNKRISSFLLGWAFDLNEFFGRLL